MAYQDLVRVALSDLMKQSGSKSLVDTVASLVDRGMAQPIITSEGEYGFKLTQFGEMHLKRCGEALH